MKRRTVVLVMTLLLTAGAMSGCAETPEDSLVKMKGKASEKNYEEAQTGQSIRTLTGAPETYQNQVSDATGKLVINTNAVVEIPEAEKASAIAVSQHPFDQAMIDKITDVFVPDATIYTADSYYTRTKDVVMKELTQWKGYLAEGNLDPNGLGKDENGNYFLDIHQVISELEEEYETAPETRTLKEVHPQFGLEYDDGVGGTWVDENYFRGIAEMPDGKKYRCVYENWGPYPMNAEFVNLETLEGNSLTNWGAYTDYSDSENIAVPSEEELKAEAGITLEEAVSIAEEKVAALGFPGMELTKSEFALCVSEPYSRNSNEKSTVAKSGYELHFTRHIQNIPITYTIELGGALEDMESDMETWGYETLDFYISKDGIEKVVLNNLYDIGETKTEQVNLKSFDEIMDIYEKMMLIQNADIMNYEESRTYHIDRITFGYGRIYEPSTDSRSGLLVPVWDFFGYFEGVNSQENQDAGAPETFANHMANQSYLTINAIDGSVIDRGLGY